MATEPKPDATRMGLVAVLTVLSLSCFLTSGLMWFGTLLPEGFVWWTLVTAGAAFASSLVLGSILAVIGARKRSDTLMEGEELDELGAQHGVKRLPGESCRVYRRRLQRRIVSRNGNG